MTEPMQRLELEKAGVEGERDAGNDTLRLIVETLTGHDCTDEEAGRLALEAARAVRVEREDREADLLYERERVSVLTREREDQDRRIEDAKRQAWQEGYAAAEYMAKCWGHVDYWENEPANPYAAKEPTQ